MRIKTVISALSLSLTMAVAGPVFAQASINGTEISAEDLPAVQARCDEIAAAAATPAPVADENSSDGNANSGDAGNNGNVPAQSDETKENDGSSDTATAFDLGTLNAETCAQLTMK